MGRTFEVGKISSLIYVASDSNNEETMARARIIRLGAR